MKLGEGRKAPVTFGEKQKTAAKTKRRGRKKKRRKTKIEGAKEERKAREEVEERKKDRIYKEKTRLSKDNYFKEIFFKFFGLGEKNSDGSPVRKRLGVGGWEGWKKDPRLAGQKDPRTGPTC